MLVALCASCASTPVEPAVLDGGRSLWRRVESEHFLVESNLSNDHQVRRIASEFEVLWHAFAAVPVLGLRPPQEKPIVVVLRDRDEYRYMAGDQTAGLYFPDTMLGPLILLPPNIGAFEETVVKHELAHHIASGSFPTEPQWLYEGLAELMETASYDTRKGEILFGMHSYGLVASAAPWLPAKRFTQPWPSGRPTSEVQSYYGRSWLLVHYLIDNELQGFLNMLVRIRHGEAWQSAWDHELLLKQDEVDGALGVYHERAKYGLWKVQAQLPDSAAFQSSDVAPAEALALRAVLNGYATSLAREPEQKRQAAERDFQDACRLDPSAARVRTILAALEAAAK